MSHAPASAPAPLSALLEAALYCPDLDAAEAFYGGVLGLTRLTRAGDRHVFYRVGGAVLLIFNPAETAKPPSPGALPVPPHGARGPGHLCFAASDAGITLWRQRLEEAGHPIEADFRWPNGARSLYFRDPAGNSIEIAEPRLWFAAGEDG
ncbi:VOC family protein [Actibacterium sp. MT2.3-13A]|uniref:VOC family protein n=1 Tax=Actibacterium sp. MT2.3-13A TaxID=2828332 RepID=UPI001BA44B33|nr:VOC family protein [Actibacterium sp. MT2.3-13A]